MSVTIGLNIASLRAQRQLAKSTDALSSTYERLSSGQRINRASDDAAGLSILSSLNSDSRVFGQAIRNVNDGISMLNVADGALAALSDITIRQKELAEQAANGSYSLTQRRAMNTEANALVDEFNRIVQSTKYNGISLLDGSSATDTSIQVGYGNINALKFNTVNQLQRTVGTGTFAAQNTSITAAGIRGAEDLVADFNRDGNIDIFSTDGTYFAGNGNGTFAAGVVYSAGGNFGAVGDFNGDGSVDVISGDSTTNVGILLSNGNGSFKAQVSYTIGTSIKHVTTGDFNGDGALDFAAANNSDRTFRVVLGNGNGTFKSSTSFSINEPTNLPWAIASTDLNNDGRSDIVTGETNGTLSVALGTGTGSFLTAVTYSTGGLGGADDIQFGDFNGDGISDIATANYSASGNFSILIGRGDGTFATAVTYSAPSKTESLAIADYNGDGLLDVASANAFGATDAIGISLGNGNGTFKATTTYASALDPYGIKAADFNNDGVSDLLTANFPGGNAYLGLYIQNSTRVTTTPQLNLNSQSSAREAFTTLDGTLNRIIAQRGDLGAFQSRLQAANNNLQSTRENYQAAASRIGDADIAQESAELVRRQILQNAATAILAQANQQPALALKLLG